MKAYIVTTGIVFALLAVVHVWRFFEEGTGVVDPFFIAITVAAVAFAIWAWRVGRKA